MSAKTKALQLVKSAQLTTREELTAAVISTADQIMQRDKLTLARDEAIKELEERFNLEIELLNESIGKNETAIESWAKRNRKDYFGDARKFICAGHSLEFRMSPGKVETARGITQNDAVEVILGGDEELANEFLAVKTTLDKNAILKAYDADKGDPKKRSSLEAAGITVVYPELFTFKPNQATTKE